MLSWSVPVGDNSCWVTSSVGGLRVRDNLNAPITALSIDVSWVPWDAVSCCSDDDGVMSP